MIEINLIPDVKQEYLKAKRARMLVISGAIIVSIISVVIVLLLAVYLFVFQAVRSQGADTAIKNKQQKITSTADLTNMLTLQSQLANISSLHSKQNISSRMFEVLGAIRPTQPNQVTFSTVKYDAENKTVHIDGQAVNGFVAVDVFKKTIEATTFSYQKDNKTTTRSLANNVTLSNLSYGEDASGAKVLRFTVDFVYDPSLFESSSKNVVVRGPDKQNATDSYKYLPTSLFSSRATDAGGKS